MGERQGVSKPPGGVSRDAYACLGLRYGQEAQCQEPKPSATSSSPLDGER